MAAGAMQMLLLLMPWAVAVAWMLFWMPGHLQRHRHWKEAVAEFGAESCCARSPNSRWAAWGDIAFVAYHLPLAIAAVMAPVGFRIRHPGLTAFAIVGLTAFMYWRILAGLGHERL
jgi:hypothetical protein